MVSLALSIHVGFAQDPPPERHKAIENQKICDFPQELFVVHPGLVPKCDVLIINAEPQCLVMAFAEALPTAVISAPVNADADYGSRRLVCSISPYNLYKSDYSIPAAKTRNCSTGYWC